VEENIVCSKGTGDWTVEVAVENTREEVGISLPSDSAGEESSSSTRAVADKVEGDGFTRVDIVFTENH